MDPVFYEQLSGQVEADPVEGFYRVTTVHTPLPTPQPINLPPVNRDHLAHFYPPGVTRAQQSGEFRQIVTLFISLPTIRTEAQLRIFMQTLFSLQEQYAGLLNRLDFGDKGAQLLIFWGVPISYENDIQRALHFILDLQTQTAIPINGGITYHVAHAGYIGSSLRGEYTCHGRGVNLAARFMTSAPRGEIWVDEAAARRAGSGFDLEFEAEKSFKGFADPQKVYILFERKDRTEPLYSGRLVGREAELARLRHFVEPLDDGRSPGTIVIGANPGPVKAVSPMNSSATISHSWRLRRKTFLPKPTKFCANPSTPSAIGSIITLAWPPDWLNRAISAASTASSMTSSEISTTKY